MNKKGSKENERFHRQIHVFLDCPATTRDEALAFIASKAVELGIASDEQAVLTSFKERENAGSTGMIGGFAILMPSLMTLLLATLLS